MTPPSEKLAGSLGALRSLHERGIAAIRAADLARGHRERLVRHGFLQPVIKGWYIAGSPDDGGVGDTTAWYASFWSFCAGYLRARFREAWCLSPEQSLALHAGNRTVPGQLLAGAPGPQPGDGTAPRDVATRGPRGDARPRARLDLDGMRSFSLSAALVACPERFFRRYPIDRTALALASDLLRLLLDGGHSTVAGRLAAAFRAAGREGIADDIVGAMRAAEFGVRERNPFEAQTLIPHVRREASPLAHRLHLTWDAMRGGIVGRFPQAPRHPGDVDAVLERIEDAYVTDAYHSLSIEGYRVSPTLIDRVRSGVWNPDRDAGDRAQRDALAARGYWQAHQVVRGSVRRVVEGEHPATVAEEDHRTWYRELFAPSVAAGLARPADLAGYRDGPVYIKGSTVLRDNGTARWCRICWQWIVVRPAFRTGPQGFPARSAAAVTRRAAAQRVDGRG